MMQAPDNHCSARPGSRKEAASAPPGAMAISSDPMMLSTKPAITTRTRPMRSAKPPTNTMKMPEKRAVSATAMFIRPAPSPRSFCMSGAMFSVVWAKSQKASTPRIIPSRSLSFPWNPLCLPGGARALATVADMAASLIEEDLSGAYTRPLGGHSHGAFS